MKIVFLTTLLTLMSFFGKSQISVTSQIEKVKKPIEKPIPYDNSTNISQNILKKHNDFYYGLEGFFAAEEVGLPDIYSEKPIYDNNNGFSYDEINATDFINKKFTVLEGIPVDSLNKYFQSRAALLRTNDLSFKNFKTDILSRDYDNLIAVKIVENESKEIFYFVPSEFEESFILNGYFENLTQKFTSKDVRVLNEEIWLNDFRNTVLNLTTDEKINVPFKSVWNIEKLTYLQLEMYGNSYMLCFLLSNSNVGKLAYHINVNESNPFKSIQGNPRVYDIILEDDYQINVLKNLKLKEGFRLKREKEFKRISILENLRKSELITEFGSINGLLIFKGKVEIGMTKEMCEKSWGIPISVKTIFTEGAKFSQWTYYQNRKLIFKDNYLTIVEF